jgi:hypothetical protein
MSLSVAELIDALPEPAEADDIPHDAGSEVFQRLSLRPAPVGRLHRLGLLGTLKAKIAAAYVFHWLRGWFKSVDENKRLLAETHWRTAVRVLDSMSYLRGAVMKVGQTLANFPDIVPREFVETLEQLHCNAPPMHWSLLREMVHNELGDDPESLFAEFDKQAFAAASLGQVHAARLASGDELAVKIQYPGIARTISDDCRNLLLFLLPNRLNRDWDCFKDQLDDLRQRLGSEKRALRAFVQGGGAPGIEWAEVAPRFGIGVSARPKWELLYEEHSALLDAFWKLTLQLGRNPAPEEFSRFNELCEAIGSGKRALRLFVRRGLDRQQRGECHRKRLRERQWMEELAFLPG